MGNWKTRAISGLEALRIRTKRMYKIAIILFCLGFGAPKSGLACCGVAQTNLEVLDFGVFHGAIDWASFRICFVGFYAGAISVC
jgi:hypothetical protein